MTESPAHKREIAGPRGRRSRGCRSFASGSSWLRLLQLQLTECRLYIAEGDALPVERLDEPVDHAATGQPDIPSVVVGDAKMQQLGLASLDRLLAGVEHRAFDAAAADRASHAAAGRHRHLGADTARRRAERLDDGGGR